MAIWLVPALKAILPHIGTILSVAVPAFTKKSAGVEANQALLQQQIIELQSAASQNALLIKELAAQLQNTVAALEQAAAITDARLRRMYLLSFVAIVLSAISLSVTLYFIFVKK